MCATLFNVSTRVHVRPRRAKRRPWLTVKVTMVSMGYGIPENKRIYNQTPCKMSPGYRIQAKTTTFIVGAEGPIEHSSNCLFTLRTRRVGQTQTKMKAKNAYLKGNAVLYEQLFGEQPDPCNAVTDIAALGVHGIQGCLSSPFFPYLIQCHTASAGATVC